MQIQKKLKANITFGKPNQGLVSSWNQYVGIIIVFVLIVGGTNYWHVNYTLSTRVEEKMNLIKLRISELEGKGIKVDGLEKTLEDIEKNEGND